MDSKEPHDGRLQQLVLMHVMILTPEGGYW